MGNTATANCSNYGQVTTTRVDEITTIERGAKEARARCHRCGNWTVRITYRSEE